MKRHCPISAVLTHDDPTMRIGDDVENLGILNAGPGLSQYKDHFKYRMGRYLDQKKLIEKHEGGLEEFAKGNPLIWKGYYTR